MNQAADDRSSARYQCRTREVYLTASMGIALFPQDGADVQALLRNADTAFHR